MAAAARAAIAVNSSMKASHALASKTATGIFLGFFLWDFAPHATAGGGLSGRGGLARSRPLHDCRIACAMTPTAGLPLPRGRYVRSHDRSADHQRPRPCRTPLLACVP